MLYNQKEIEVNGKKYVLTVQRSLLFRIATIVPEILNFAKESKSQEGELEKEQIMSQERMVELFNNSTIDKLYDNMNVIFYEMLKHQHKDISFEKSNEIYLNFCYEYNDVEEHLMALIEKVFTQGIPRKEKKNLNW